MANPKNIADALSQLDAQDQPQSQGTSVVTGQAIAPQQSSVKGPTNIADALSQLDADPDAAMRGAPPTPGQQTNDVGNTVIVPKDGESFADTMKRAAAQGKNTTPEQINKELATAPGKAGEALLAAPAAGFLGAATLATPASIKAFIQSEAGKDLMKVVLKHTGEKLLTGATIGVGYEVIHQAAKLLGLVDK